MKATYSVQGAHGGTEAVEESIDTIGNIIPQDKRTAVCDHPESERTSIHLHSREYCWKCDKYI